MDSIKKVAVSGATGTVGMAIIKSLAENDFEVTALVRETKEYGLPPQVTIQVVDYEHTTMNTLTSMLTGQDAVVCALGGPDSSGPQLLLTEAAVKAGVKRFIPADYGIDTENARATSLPFFDTKRNIHESLKRYASMGSITYSLICTGAFLDHGLETGFLVNLREKTVKLYDGGDVVFSTTIVADVAKAVTGVLKHYEETINRAVYVQTTETTLKKLAEMAMEATGPEGWKQEVVSAGQLLQEGYDERKKAEPNISISEHSFICVAGLCEGYGTHFKHLDNELLGIKQLDDTGLEALVSNTAKIIAQGTV
ncbi:nmrA-like family protein-like protein [Xylariaceae sp. FL1019]|nr:nmrA-like family protein-like protein [Xylariaceae sp. FL1019]